MREGTSTERGRFRPDDALRSPPMRRSRCCPKCGGTDLVHNEKLGMGHIDGSRRYLHIAPMDDPEDDTRYDPVGGYVHAIACARCGYMELYAQKPERFAGLPHWKPL